MAWLQPLNRDYFDQFLSGRNLRTKLSSAILINFRQSYFYVVKKLLKNGLVSQLALHGDSSLLSENFSLVSESFCVVFREQKVIIK